MSDVAPARLAAYTTILRVFEDGAYADRAFHAAARGLDGRDRSLAMALAYGTVQRTATLDHVAEALSSRPTSALDSEVLAAVRLGLLQLLFLGGIADHAAVNDSVELAKMSSPPTRGGAGLVNAVLRRATREGRAMIDALDDDTPAAAAVKHSVPEWLAALWFDELGPDRARTLLAAINRPAEAALRVNTLASTAEEVLAALPVPARATELPEGLVLEAPFDAFGSELFRAGAIMPQSRASMRVARTLAPQPGERVLDLCAAPGAKTTHLAALIGGHGSVRAVEQNGKRADGLRRTAARLHAESAVTVEVADAVQTPPSADYDRVLVDPPCSGLGTLQSRPDLRWRTSPERIAELSVLQRRILAAGAAATRPGGTLVYSVCTISRAESGAVLEDFLTGHTGWRADPPVTLAPDTDQTDGFWIAHLHRER